MVAGSLAMALLTPLFFLASGSLAVLGVTAVVCGLAISPTLIVGFALVEELAPAERLTESLTWLSTGIALGVALSAAVSGCAHRRLAAPVRPTWWRPAAGSSPP